MKKYFLSLISLLITIISFAQTSREEFETESDGSNSFTDNAVTFNIISHQTHFDVGRYTNLGWNGTGIDHQFIDNSGTSNTSTPGSSFSIKTTSNLFRVNQFWVYVADRYTNPNATGSLILTGKLSGVPKFNVTKSSGFNTGTTYNGFTLIDMTTFTGNPAGIVIDELQLTLDGNYRYIALDAFTWVKDPGMVLPVTFGSVTASAKNNQLHVSWTTEKETANDHFEIEASVDGKHFVKIATVASKANDGNSDIKLHYEWASNGALPLAAFSLVGLLFIPFAKLHRKKAWILAVALSGISVFTITACSKSTDTISQNESYYIRVAQVDKDATKTYSKVVMVQQH